MSTDRPLGFPFEVGHTVEKTGGDYTFVGTIVAAFVKLDGKPRYVVEDDRGVLHVYSAGNLRRVAPKVTAHHCALCTTYS